MKEVLIQPWLDENLYLQTIRKRKKSRRKRKDGKKGTQIKRLKCNERTPSNKKYEILLKNLNNIKKDFSDSSQNTKKKRKRRKRK